MTIPLAKTEQIFLTPNLGALNTESNFNCSTKALLYSLPSFFLVITPTLIIPE